MNDPIQYLYNCITYLGRREPQSCIKSAINGNSIIRTGPRNETKTLVAATSLPLSVPCQAAQLCTPVFWFICTSDKAPVKYIFGILKISSDYICLKSIFIKKTLGKSVLTKICRILPKLLSRPIFQVFSYKILTLRIIFFGLYLYTASIKSFSWPSQYGVNLP